MIVVRALHVIDQASASLDSYVILHDQDALELDKGIHIKTMVLSPLMA